MIKACTIAAVNVDSLNITRVSLLNQRRYYFTALLELFIRRLPRRYRAVTTPGGCSQSWRETGLQSESRRRGPDCAVNQHGRHNAAEEMGRDAIVRRAVFLDRDGVLNKAIVRNGKPYPPRDVSELIIADGALASLEALKREGLLLLVITNQPDIARGQTNRADVDKINAQLVDVLPLDAVEVCDHDDTDQCDCRKPKAGMILRLQRRFALDLAHSFMVGDRWRDIEAGRRAGCRTVLIGDGYGETFPSAPSTKVASLPEAAAWIIQQGRLEQEIV
jgi:D-glycero-D-manno-heptose 1,7-bisphosphate phosphatase